MSSLPVSSLRCRHWCAPVHRRVIAARGGDAYNGASPRRARMAPATEGFLPGWTLGTRSAIAPEERLPWGQTIALGLQHIFAMFGATVLAPILMGFDPNIAILFSGVGTLIFFFVVGGRVPSYLGSSFAFIAVVIAATGYSGRGANPNVGVALGGIIACGA